MQEIFWKVRSSICLVIAIWGLTGCQSFNGQNTAHQPPSTSTDSCPQYSPDLDRGVTSVPSETFNPSKIVRGQKLYVPVYSEIYQPKGFDRLRVFGTLSIRNTSETEEIRITKVDYFHTSGKLVKKCLEGNHSVLSPMAATEFEIAQQDNSGDSGASFIVEWVSEKSVSDPVVEAIMITASGNQSYNFTSHGRVIKEIK